MKIMEDSRSWRQQQQVVRGRSNGINDSWNRGASIKRRSGGGSKRVDWRRRRKRHRRPLGEKIADWFRAFLAFLFSNVGIICLVIGYTVAGAVIFEFIEGNNSKKIGNGTQIFVTRNITAVELWNITYEVNIFSERIWKSKVDKILQNYQKTVIDAVKSGWDGTDSMDNRKWSFAGAFLYSLTVITTIGYGNTTPKTMSGKVITIGYAIAGMPLFLLYLSNIGDILARSFKWTYARCCLCRCRKRPRVARNPSNTQPCNKNTWQMVRMHSNRLDTVSLDGEIESMSKTTASDDDEEEEEEEEEDDESDRYDPQRITVPLTLCLGIMVGYICGGALLFSEWEDWGFLDGSYFCFVSLSTIGFGDIVPGDKIYSGQGIELSFIFCSMYLMLGMALIAMCFNLMQEEVMAKMRSFTRTVKHVLRCDR